MAQNCVIVSCEQVEVVLQASRLQGHRCQLFHYGKEFTWSGWLRCSRPLLVGPWARTQQAALIGLQEKWSKCMVESVDSAKLVQDVYERMDEPDPERRGHYRAVAPILTLRLLHSRCMLSDGGYGARMRWVVDASRCGFESHTHGGQRIRHFWNPAATALPEAVAKHPLTVGVNAEWTEHQAVSCETDPPPRPTKPCPKDVVDRAFECSADEIRECLRLCWGSPPGYMEVRVEDYIRKRQAGKLPSEISLP